ncbi:VOC family protein [Saccharococcus caldoxylosilyticus]|jgi:glyoxylase I family protein|uniref:SMU1112c/YaeR family gloxylase I-like metalloprotein n=1 Tax=Saccharococcus caldoxylosilyticus TaxID=81408 RepID=UPI001C4E0DD1|nr:VOC family protein [Parageobacillus caldoxylosilyticus]QXJ38698.1 putative lyase [Parageobacillus caldoxylosilyticus]BDG37600.1 VOC family protein [Parageobacillus caldoxylosilyticus]BDG41392.1 VOC family protein [Parageobacillus caldoxylosilyticus]
MHFTRVHHIAIICSDYERSKHFYTNILRFRVIHEQYREERRSYKLDLQVGEHTQIELFSFEHPPKRPSHPEACGLRHLALEVENIEEAIAYLHTHGIETEPIRVDPITGKRFTFFRDPDELPIELYER